MVGSPLFRKKGYRKGGGRSEPVMTWTERIKQSQRVLGSSAVNIAAFFRGTDYGT